MHDASTEITVSAFWLKNTRCKEDMDEKFQSKNLDLEEGKIGSLIKFSPSRDWSENS